MTHEELELIENLKSSDWEPGRAAAGALAAILQERDEAKARIKELEAALRWYAELAILARFMHLEGDAGRAATANEWSVPPAQPVERANEQ